MIHRMLLLSMSPLFLGKPITHMLQKTGVIKKEQSNSDFVCRIVTSPLNNSPNCSMNWSFSLDILRDAFMGYKQMKADLKVSYPELITTE